MDENGLPITGAGVNYSSVEAINQRELITYFNMFLVRTCSFLNNFSTKCESKLAELNNRLASIDASITLLETKLDSVDELKNVKLDDVNNVAPSQTPQQPTEGQPVEPSQSVPPGPEPVSMPSTEPEVPVITVSQDERFARFFKMLKFGVAEQAVKLKMEAEGVDSSLLDNPDAPAPP